MITPALSMILSGYPEAEVHVVTGQDGRRVLKGFHPNLTRFFDYTRRFPRTLWVGPALVRELKRESYDHLFLFETNPHYHKLLNGVARQTHTITNLKPDIHYCVRCLEVVENALVKPPSRGWLHLPVTDSARSKAHNLLERNGIGPNHFVIGLHPTYSGMTLPFYRQWGGRKEHRTWPQASFAELARKLSHHARENELDVKILLDILPEERALLTPLIQSCGDSLTVTAEPPDFERYKAIIQRMDLLVAPDTGPMHIAGAVGTSLVALFSGKSPGDCGPFVPAERASILRSEETEHPGRGLAAISPESVFGACLPFLPKK